MILRNGIIALLGCDYGTKLTLRDISGNFIGLEPSKIRNFLRYVVSSSSSDCIAMPKFGNGSTKETLYDYKLENEIKSYTVLSKTISYIPSSSEFNEIQWVNPIQKYEWIIKNNANSDITISEFGLASYLNYQTILLFRKTFDPITIAPDENYTFTYYLGE